MSLRRAAITTLLLTCAACVPRAPAPTPAPPVERPVARPTPTPTPVPTYTSWMDVPQTLGDWRYETSARGSAAVFGAGASDMQFALRCTRGVGSITLARAGSFAPDTRLTVRTESMTRAVQPAPIGENNAWIGSLNANDPLLDAMAFSKGRFAIEAAGAPTLYLPSWPEVTRVIEDCR